MNNQTQQACCARHEALLAKESSLRTREQKFDAWIEQHCSDSSKYDEEDLMDFEPRPTGYYYHSACVAANDDHMQLEESAFLERPAGLACDDKGATRMGPQDYSLTCEHCHMEAAVKWSLKLLGLDDIAFWKQKEDKN